MSLRGLLRTASPRALNSLVEGDREIVLERAYAIARVAGGALAFAVAPSFGLSLPLVVGLMAFTVIGPGLLHIWLWSRIKTARGRERVRWLTIANDCIAGAVALAVFARDPMWTVTLIVPLLIFVETIRAGAPGGIITTIVISIAHLMLADIRRSAYGFTPDPTTLFFQIGLYWLALLLAVAIFRELQVLQVMRADLFGPLLLAQDRFGDGVLIRRGDRFVFVGDAMRRITGRDPEELETLPSMRDLTAIVRTKETP